MNRILLASIASLGSFAFSAPAGEVTDIPRHNATLTITEEGNAASWLVDLGGLLSFDPSTGELAMPFAAPDTPVLELPNLPVGWSWNWVSTQSGAPSDGWAARWHTPERISASQNSPWRSAIDVFKLQGNVDPFMSYGFTVRNNTTLSQNYTFSYGESVLPNLAGPYNLYADVAGSLVNATSGSVSLSPLGTDTDGDGILELQQVRLSTDGGQTFVNGGVDVGPSASSSVVGSTTYGVFSATTAGVAVSPLDYWEFQVNFTLSPGRDVATLSGFAELTQIPEPSAYALVLTGLTLAVAVTRRSRARHAL